MSTITHRRDFFRTAATGLGGLAILSQTDAAFAAEPQGQTLHNGIRIPATWPPRIDKLTHDA